MKFKEKTVFTYKNISVFVSFQNLPNSGIALFNRRVNARCINRNQRLAVVRDTTRST